jgi:hypothetical protein
VIEREFVTLTAALGTRGAGVAAGDEKSGIYLSHIMMYLLYHDVVLRRT